MSTRKTNKAATRRTAAEYAARIQQEAQPLPERYAEYLAKFQPHTPMTDPQRAKEAVVSVMSRASHLAWDNFRKHCSDVAALVGWAQAHDECLDWDALMTHAVIHAFAATPSAGSSDAHRAERMRRLKALATRLNPGSGAPPRPTPISHRAVQDPYTETEMHAIRRVCLTQPSGLRRRQLCAVVGTSRGGGASTSELRVLTGGHFCDLGVDGIYVSLGRDQSARRIPIRYEWEDLVREGLAGIGSRELLFGIKEDRRNVAARVIEGATILGSDCPRIDAARLRSTWLADLMMDTIPVNVILHAAGLRGARSLTDIAAWLQRTGQVHVPASLRGERP